MPHSQQQLKLLVKRKCATSFKDMQNLRMWHEKQVLHEVYSFLIKKKQA